MIPLQFVDMYLTELEKYGIDLESISILKQLLVKNIPTTLVELEPAIDLINSLVSESLRDTSSIGNKITNIELMDEAEILTYKRLCIRTFLAQLRMIVEMGVLGNYNLFERMEFMDTANTIPSNTYIRRVVGDWRSFKDDMQEIDKGMASSELLGNVPHLVGHMHKCYQDSPKLEPPKPVVFK